MHKKILIALAAILISLALAQEAANEAFVNSDLAPLYSDAEATGEAAQLRITSALEVLDTSESSTLVRVSGWITAQNLPNGGPIYTNRTDLIEITPSAQPEALTELGTDGDWTEVELRGWISSEALAADRTEMFAAAAKVYQSNCTRCHAGYAGPVEQLIVRLQPREWPEVATRMAMGTGISKADLSLLIHWLQTESQLVHAEQGQ